MEESKSTPFLEVPLEIRREIYKHLLVGPAVEVEGAEEIVTIPDYHLYERISETEEAPETKLCFRNTQQMNTRERRSMYKIRSDRFRARCMDATYTCANRPAIDPTILLVNRQIYREAAEVLYGSYTFDFDTHIEACVPFLSDLSPVARKCVRSISIVKRALPYDKDFDRCEWSAMCSYLSEDMRLNWLVLGVVAGKPVAGWDHVRPFDKDEFRTVLRFPEMGWVNDLVSIRGLAKLSVRACVEHCPPPMSSVMEFFVTFSASVEKGFAQYLSAIMIDQAA